MAQLGFVGAAVLCGLFGVCPFLIALNGWHGSLILVYLTQLPFFVAGLWLGTGAAALAGSTAFLILLGASGLTAAALFATLNAVPVALLVRQALLARTSVDGAIQWYPPGLLTAWLTGLGLTAMAAALLLLGGAEGLRAVLQEMLAPAFDRILIVPAPDRDNIAKLLVFVMPGTVAASWMAMVATNGGLAQGVLARFGLAWRPSPDLATLALPMWLPLLLAVATAAAAFGGDARFLGVNVMILLIVPFCLAGLAVLHRVARRLSHPAMALAAFYVAATVFGWPLLLIALVGLLDSALGQRRLFAQPQFFGGK
jgi:hypothetical protein